MPASLGVARTWRWVSSRYDLLTCEASRLGPAPNTSKCCLLGTKKI